MRNLGAGGSRSYVRWLANFGSQDVKLAEGKNTSLGAMIGTLKVEGLQVPDGFATTAGKAKTFVNLHNLQ
jgi:pyruvate,water dikinase